MIAALIMVALALEVRLPFLVDQPGGRIGKGAFGIAQRLHPLGVEEQGPAGAEPLQHIVDACGGRDELGLGGAFEVGSPEPKRSLKAAVLAQHHARCDQGCPRQMVGKTVGASPIFADPQHERYPAERRCRASTAPKSGSRLAANMASVWPTAQSASPAIHC